VSEVPATRSEKKAPEGSLQKALKEALRVSLFKKALCRGSAFFIAYDKDLTISPKYVYPI